MYDIAVTLRGYSSPESSQLEHLSAVKDIEFVTDLGPEILHYYEISNFGPFDVGNVIVSQSLTQLGARQTLMTTHSAGECLLAPKNH